MGQALIDRLIDAGIRFETVSDERDVTELIPTAPRAVDGPARRRPRRGRLGGRLPRARRRAAGARPGQARRDPRRAAGRARPTTPSRSPPSCATSTRSSCRASPTGSIRGTSPTSRPARRSPAIVAELLAAALNSVSILWRTAPAATELEGVVLDWVAQLLGLPAGWHGHIEDSASTATMAALIAAREATGRDLVLCSEQAHSSVAEGRPDDRHAPAQGRDRRPSADADRRSRRPRRGGGDRGDRRHHGQHRGRRHRRDRPPVRADRHVAARRRGVCRRGDGVPRVPLGVHRDRARRLARRQRPQVDAHAAGLLAAVVTPARRSARARSA